MSSSRTDPKGLHGAEIIHLLCCLDPCLSDSTRDQSRSPAIDHKSILSVPYITDQGMHFPAVKSANTYKYKVIFRSRRSSGIQVEPTDIYQGNEFTCTTKTKPRSHPSCSELKALFSVNLIYCLGAGERYQKGDGKEGWSGELHFVNISAFSK